jgi:phenylacetate-CoA ligase
MIFGVLNKFWHLRRSQRSGVSRLEESQLAALRRIVQHAAAKVPLYADKYSVPGLRAEAITSLEGFRQLPLLRKQEFKANFPDRIVAAGYDCRSLYQVATSGTTDRMMIFHDEIKRDWDRAADLLLEIQANGWRPGWRKMLIPPDVCYERCGADEGGFTQGAGAKLKELFRDGKGRHQQLAYQVLRLLIRDYFWRVKALKGLGADGTAATAAVLDNYLEEIRNWNPAVLSGLPQILFVLAKHQRLTSADARKVRLVRPMGGKMTKVMMQVIAQSLGERVRENFGTAELGTVAFDCRHSHFQHLLSELFYVEFLRDGQPVRPGELGEIVITDLRNYAAPLIRYAVGDVGRYSEGECECGFGGRRFSVDGRLDETVVTHDGRAFAGDEVADVFLSHPDINYARVVQKDDFTFLLEAVLAGLQTARPTEGEFSQALSKLLGYPVSVRLREVRRIAPERSGKYKLVISTSHQRLQAEKTSGDVASFQLTSS